MILSDAEISQGPPPQAVLEKRPLWMLLQAMLLATALLRYITMDVVGGILTTLMLLMVIMMTANGMAEMSRYSVSFSALTMLCLFFDIMPLLASLNGRVQVVVDPGNQTQTGHETHVHYTSVIKTIPFFHGPAGLLYNLTSLSMMLSPTTMVFAMYLGSHAHIETQRSVLNIRQLAVELLNDTVGTEPARPVREGSLNRGRGVRRGGADSEGSRREFDNDSSLAAGQLHRFHGRSHRLDDC